MGLFLAIERGSGQGVSERLPHIVPYRGEHTNHVANGILLRADLHTLFDLHLLSIRPDTLRVHLAPELRDSEYEAYARKTLNLPADNDAKPTQKALITRWAMASRDTPPAKDEDVITAFTVPSYSDGDEWEGAEFTLEMNTDWTWTMWVDRPGESESEELWTLPPLEAFAKFEELPLELSIMDLDVEEVAYQDWDSGGPGAGAGRISVYRLGNDRVGCVYFGSHDAGWTEPYETLEEAAGVVGVSCTNEATREIWYEDDPEE